MDLGPILLTLKLASATTLILLVLGLPLAWWLSRAKWRGVPFFEALVSMPLVLPPSVIGFYLLISFSPNSSFGRFFNQTLGIDLAFSFEGLVFASVIYSLPFMVNPLLAGFRALPNGLLEAAAVLGKSPRTILWNIAIPNTYPALASALVMTFAHTIGEFGVVLMIGGNIPGETRVASIAVFDAVESLRYGDANAYSLILLVMSFTLLMGLFFLTSRQKRKS
jgi:molybdate transport system permease protein